MVYVGHDELYDLACGRPWGENGAHPAPKEFVSVLIRDCAPSHDEYVARSRLGQKVDDPGDQRQVSAGKHRQPDSIDVFFHRCRHDLLRCVVQTGVDNLHPGVP